MAVTAAQKTDNTRRVSPGEVDRAAFTRTDGMTLPRAVDASTSRAEAGTSLLFFSEFDLSKMNILCNSEKQKETKNLSVWERFKM